MRSIVSGDYYRNFNIGIHKETPLRSKLCGRTSPARYLLPSVVSAGTNQVVSHHHHRRSQPAELAWGSVGLGKQLDPYRGSEGRADPIWLSVEGPVEGGSQGLTRRGGLCLESGCQGKRGAALRMVARSSGQNLRAGGKSPSSIQLVSSSMKRFISTL